jgi:hypothetical protein
VIVAAAHRNSQGIREVDGIREIGAPVGVLGVEVALSKLQRAVNKDAGTLNDVLRQDLAEFARRLVVRRAVVVGHAGDEQVLEAEQSRLFLRFQAATPALARGRQALD